jgi:hypothetical protein
MGRAAIAQRLGYMLEYLEHKPGEELKAVLDMCLSTLDSQDATMYQQLLPGLHYQDLKHPWLVFAP